MDWDKLKTFYYVAQMGSFTNAANFLNISQSAISRQISELERKISLRVFERHARGLVLTQAGQILFQTAKNIFYEIQSAENMIQDTADEPQGVLKIATAAGFIATMLLEYIDEFYEKYPKLNLQIKFMDTHPDLAFREADIAILTPMPETSSIVQKYLMSFHLKLYASKKYLNKYGTPETVNDLSKHRLLAYDNDESSLTQPMDWHLITGLNTARPRNSKLAINSSLNLAYAVHNGAGIVSLAAEDPMIKQYGLVNVLPDLSGNTMKAHLIYPKFLENSTAVKTFEIFLNNIIKRNNWI